MVLNTASILLVQIFPKKLGRTKAKPETEYFQSYPNTKHGKKIKEYFFISSKFSTLNTFLHIDVAPVEQRIHKSPIPHPEVKAEPSTSLWRQPTSNYLISQLFAGCLLLEAPRWTWGSLVRTPHAISSVRSLMRLCWSTKQCSTDSPRWEFKHMSEEPRLCPLWILPTLLWRVSFSGNHIS